MKCCLSTSKQLYFLSTFNISLMMMNRERGRPTDLDDNEYANVSHHRVSIEYSLISARLLGSGCVRCVFLSFDGEKDCFFNSQVDHS